MVSFSTQQSLQSPGTGSDNKSLLTDILEDWLVLRWLLRDLRPEFWDEIQGVCLIGRVGEGKSIHVQGSPLPLETYYVWRQDRSVT